MKTILLIIKKDLKLFFSNKKAVVLTFLIPIILISLFAFAFGGIGKKSNSKKQVELLYTNLDTSETSFEIIEQLDALEEIKLTEISINESKNLVKKGKKAAHLTINKGLKDSLINGNKLPIIFTFDAAKQFENGILKSIVTGKIMSIVGKEIQQNSIKKYINNSYSYLSENQKEKIVNDISKSNFNNSNNEVFQSVSVINKEDKKGNLGLIQAVAGTAILMLLFSVSGMGSGLLEEKESGTLARLLYAPLKATDILFGKMGATFVLALLQLIVMFLFAWLAFGLDIFTDILSLITLTLAVAFAVSSFGISLVSIAKSRQQLQNLSTIIILIMSAVGGSMIPLFIMPEIMQKIAVLSLNYWGIQGYYDIFWRGISFIEILPKIGILCLIGTIMMLISVPLYKKNIVSLTN